MKEYLVKNYYKNEDNAWIVLAEDKNDAIDQVWNNYIVPRNRKKIEERQALQSANQSYRLCSKDELHAQSLEELHHSIRKTVYIC